MVNNQTGGTGSRWEVTIDKHYVGPTDIAQGGYVGGRMAEYLGSDTVEVTMRNPTPMGRPVIFDTSEPGLVLLYDGDKLLNEARPAKLDMEIPEPVSFEEAQEASLRHVTETPFPNCFGCGAARSEDEGLHLRSGPVKRRNMVAIDWVPRAAAVGAEEGEDVPLPIVWAAMECPVSRAWDIGGLKGDDELAVLGRMTTKVITRPKVGQKCFIMGWPIERAGRRIELEGSLHNEKGEVMVMTHFTFVTLKADVTVDSFVPKKG